MRGTLVQLNVSPGGMPKLPIPSALVTKTGVAGDRQRNLKYHGGPDRAVCLFSTELYDWLRDDEQIDLPWGSIGENFTTRGIDLRQLNGDRLRVGAAGCIIQLTKVREPCRNLNRWDPRLLELIEGRSGWVAKVLSEGPVSPGDEIEILPQFGNS
jgi:MOSC domain-containing protein YiiM